MNRIILLIFLLCIMSCSVNKSTHFDSLNNKKVNFYENQYFSFEYPLQWKIFETKYYEKDIVLRIAHRGEITSGYMVPENILKNGHINKSTFIPFGTNIKAVREEHLKYFNNPDFLTEYAKNQFNISIESKSLINLSDFINMRRTKMAKLKSVDSYFTKINDNHYINKLRIYVNDKERSPSLTQDYLMHYYYFDGVLFTLVFMTTLEKKDKYTEDAELIFRTFQFKGKIKN